MKISKKKLIKLIRESIDRNRKHYKGEPNRNKEFGDYLWPDFHIDYKADTDADIEENTYSENDVLNQLMMYYQTDTFNTDIAMTNTSAQIIKDAALKRTYPFVFRQHQGLAYRGMALYKNDYERLYSSVPSSYKLTARERDKFNISPPDEKKYQDPITSFLSITSVPLINFYERMITKLGNVLSFSTDANKRKEWDYENTILRDIPVTDEDYDFLHTKEYQHDANPADKFSSFDDDLYPNFKSELGLSDWNTSPRAAGYYAMEAARKLKAARSSQEVIPFMIICDPRKTSKGVFVDLYTGIKEQYPKLEKELMHLKKGDILLIGDADIERLTVFDNRGMGLKESNEVTGENPNQWKRKKHITQDRK